MDDNSKETEDDPQEIELPIAWTEVLTDRKIARAINTVADAWAKHLPDLNRLRWRSLIANLAFGVLVLVVILVAGFYKVISADVTGSLLGALIGYWYGSYRSSK